jgi:excinuclease UvrABC helicase subunit UvrB
VRFSCAAHKKYSTITLVLAHNKTLAAQLYSEFKQFFPNNAVEYFCILLRLLSAGSFMPVTEFIEKDLSINEELKNENVNNCLVAFWAKR